jgi:2-haloacid dehalogenase
VAVGALLFDVFGTLADWRSSIAREAKAILGPLGYSLDWPAFADAWRGEYQPAMEEIRSGKASFSKLDVLHRRSRARLGAPQDALSPRAVLQRQHLADGRHRPSQRPAVGRHPRR